MTTMLFLDDEPLNARDNVARRQGRPRLIPESVYHEGAGNCAWGYPGVFRDPESGCWRMVYQAGLRWSNRGGGTALLLESEDGLHWRPRDTTREVPDLADRRVAHQILPEAPIEEYSSMFVDEHGPAAERLKLLTVKRGGPEGNLALLWTSPDGLRWQEMPDVRWQPEAPDPPTFIHWNALRERYVFTSRPKSGDRRICWFETLDWRTYSAPILALHADALDAPLTQIYGMPVFPYEGLYVAFPWLFHCAKNERKHYPHHYLGGHVDAQLAYSKNGLHWIRTIREPFLCNGEPGMPDSGNAQPSCMVTLDDGSLRIYADGSMHEHGHCPPEDGYLMAYELRRDGFMYLESTGGPGMIGTRALYWEGGEASLNVQAPAGWVRVQVTNPKGEPLEGYSLEESAVFQGDDTGWVPEWKDGRRISALAGKMIRFEVTLENARLYALRGDYILCQTTDVRAFEQRGMVPVARPGF